MIGMLFSYDGGSEMSDYFYSMHMLIKQGWAEATSYKRATNEEDYLDLVIYLSYEENM